MPDRDVKPGNALADLERRARDGGVSRSDLVVLCAPRAEVRCRACGRNSAQKLEDAVLEIARPCPDCGAHTWKMEGPPCTCPT